MGKQTLSNEVYRQVANTAASKGSTTWAGEERERQGLGLDPLVDPAGYDLIRRSLTRYNQEGGQWTAPCGVAMLVESLTDGTGSMRENVDLAFKSLPNFYGLLTEGRNPVLGRYDPQILNAFFGDIRDPYVLKRSQAEMAEKIATQLTLMNPDFNGFGNTHENPEYGLFGAAYLTSATINQYGLKYYHCSLSDEPLEERIDPNVLVRVYGKSVFEKVAENGRPDITRKNLPSTREVVQDLLKNAHAFFLQVLHNDGEEVRASFTYDAWTRKSWTSLYGKERVVPIPSTQYQAQIEAAIIGLTEGVIDLESVGSFLREAGVDKENARILKDAVSGIPIGAQKALPNFGKIPAKGAVFAKKGDLWPVGSDPVTGKKSKKAAKKNQPNKPGKPKVEPDDRKEDSWL